MDRTRWRAPLGIAGVALAFRLLVVVFAMRHPSFPVQPDNYLEMGRQWLAGLPRNVNYPPLYSVLCGSLLWMLDWQHAIWTVLILQAAFGAACVLLVYRLAPDHPTALLAASFVALDPSALIYSAIIATETLYTFLLLALLSLVVAALQDGRKALFAAAGIVLGLAILTRSVAITMFLPLGVLVLCWRRSLKARMLGAILLLAPCLLLLLPTAYANRKTYGAFQVSASGEYNTAVTMIGPAKSRLEGKPIEGTLDIWRDELGTEDGNPFHLASNAASVSRAWAMKHKAAVLESIAIGSGTALLGPSLAQWRRLTNSTALGLTAVLVAVRAIALLLSIAGVVVLARDRWPAVGLLLLGTVAVHVAAVGGGGHGRYAVPILPCLHILGALVISRLAGQTVSATQAPTDLM